MHSSTDNNEKAVPEMRAKENERRFTRSEQVASNALRQVLRGVRAALTGLAGIAAACALGATLMPATAVAATSGTVDVTYPYADANLDGANDYELEFGQLSDYYKFSYKTPTSTTEPADGAVTANIKITSTGSYFYRVTNPLNADAVTYGNYATFSSSKENAAVTVAASDMHVGDAAFSKKTVVRDFSRNVYDGGDLYLNAGETGQVQLNVGETFDLYPMRNWLPIESINNTQMLHPDYHVEVVDVEGTGVVDATENTSNKSSRHKWTLEAHDEGTALVKVTYDALVHAKAMKGYTDFSAIWPENTGLLVVTVGKDASMQAGCTLNEQENAQLEQDYIEQYLVDNPDADEAAARAAAASAYVGTQGKLAGNALDAELDVLYYFGNEGASYTFTPPAGAQVSVARGSVENGVLEIGAFTESGVQANADGSVTVSGLTLGKHVLKVERNGAVAYQVVRAKPVRCRVYAGTNVEYADKLIYDSDTDVLNAYTDGTTPITREAYELLSSAEREAYTPLVEPGSSVFAVFNTLYHPAGKLSGCYNMNALLSLEDESGNITEQKAPPYNGPNQYQFSSSDVCKRVSMTIPATAEDGSYTIQPHLKASGFGWPFGTHRQASYEQGIARADNYPAPAAFFGLLPALTVDVVAAAAEDPALVQARIDAATFEELVDALPAEITLAHEAQVTAAREAYETLSELAASCVSPSVLDRLVSAEGRIATLHEQAAAANEAAAHEVEELIEAIGDTPTQNLEAVQAARAAYDALTDEQKALVDSYYVDMLETAEAQIASTDAGAAAQAQGAIEAIGTVTRNAADRARLEAAETAFAALTPAQQELVSAQARQKLADARSTLDALDAQFEADKATYGSVHVVVENTTYSQADGAPWTGVLVDVDMPLAQDATLLTVLNDAIVACGFDGPQQAGGYIGSINGLAERDAGSSSGWMITLNDWFINAYSNTFKFADGAFGDGDEVRAVYSVTGGSDVGSYSNVASKALRKLEVSAGALSPAFDSSEHVYTLDVDEGVNSVKVMPTARNKNFQVHTYLGLQKDGVEYKRAQSIPIEHESLITVVCGDPSWPSMSAQTFPMQTYYLVVRVGGRAMTTDASQLVADIDAARDFEAQVAAVDGTDETAVAALRAAYNELSDGAKALVSSDALGKLESYEAAIEKKKEEEAQHGASDDPSASDPDPADSGKPAADKPAASKVAADKAAAQKVAARIGKLPAATNVTDADAKAVKAARTAYNALTAAQKKLVPASKLKALKAAENAVATTLTVNVKKLTAKVLKSKAKKAGKKLGSIKKLVLGKKVKTIKKSVFKSAKKLKTLVVKTKKLSKKTTRQCLKSSKVKTVRVAIGSKVVNKKYAKKYKKLFTKKACGKKSVKVAWK